MEAYKNLNGNSGIESYEIGSDEITIRLTDGEIYVYTNQSAGNDNIEQMKKLALAGSGLHTFMNDEVKYLYRSKLD